MAAPFSSSLTAASSTPNKQEQKDIPSIVSSSIPAIAKISTTHTVLGPRNCHVGPNVSQELFDSSNEEPPSDLHELPKIQEIQASGTGFIIQADHDSAYIVTNYHVIANANNISIVLNDEIELEGNLLASDAKTDLAVLKVSTRHLPANRQKMTPLEWGDSGSVKVGDFVLAIGNSFGMGLNVSHGIVSNLSRRLDSQTNGAIKTQFIQHSAPIHQGNSGGPLLNLEGKVVAINTVIISPNGGNVGIGLGIPCSVAKERIKQLIEFGRVRYGWLGIKTQCITGDECADLNLDKRRNYRIVSSVTPSGPGAKAQIQPGDILLSLNGTEVTEKTNLTQLISEMPVGEIVKIRLYRPGEHNQGQYLDIEATLEEFTGNHPTLPHVVQSPKTHVLNT
ncbi:MAG: trypsin-like peptidase domain-containing protein [Alphaproteobacteria bacterium]|jgi:serine protease Do|nr:trypsin-like peptidase domain-containing protein [Alphaproteobacteria bacterium]